MEERGRIPVSLPHHSSTQSYWQRPSDIADLRSDLPKHADYVVIGSGITGAFIAYNLVCKGANVVLLEARQACSGATSRNGGHTKAASYRSFLEHEEAYGNEAVKIAKMEYANIRETHAFAREHKIDCASHECDTVDIIYSQTQLDQGIRAIERMRQVVPEVEYKIARDNVLGALGSFQYAAGSLSAYALTVGVLKLALDKGLNLQTNTPVTSINPVTTNRGVIEARNVILATNGYTAHLLPQMQGLIVPLRGQVVAQKPMMPFETTYSFIYEKGYEYMISRPPGASGEGDIIIGGGLHQLPNSGASQYGVTDDSELDPTISAYLRGCTARAFDRDEPECIREWSGIMGATADGLPYVGAVPDMPGVWICAGFNGHGMVLCMKSAEALTEMIHGKTPEWFPEPMIMSKERLGVEFRGRTDLRAPGEAQFGERGQS